MLISIPDAHLLELDKLMQGHYLERPQNKMDWYSRVGPLFQKHLGGQVGPLPMITSAGARLIEDLISTL